MKVYLAARYIRRLELAGYAAELSEMGYVVTSRWLAGLHEIPEGIDGESHPEYAQRFAQEDWEDLLAADCCIAFTESGPVANGSRGGRHVELGMALAWRKHVIIVGARENVFCSLPQVKHFEDWDKAKDALAPIAV